MTWFKDELGKRLIVKVRAVLGPRRDLGDVQEVTCLNRILRWCGRDHLGDTRIEYEADSRHCEIFLKQLGLTEKSRNLSSPGHKTQGNWMDGDEISPERRKAYRSMCMRLAYLASDRPELQCPSKEAARLMQRPTLLGEQMLNTAGRSLVGAPRLVVKYEKQRPQKYVDMYCDSNHAGCTQTRKGSTGTTAMIGSH